MPFKDLGDYVLDDAPRLPFRGKVYRVPAVSAGVGVRAQAIFGVGIAAKDALDKGEDLALTDAEQELLSDEAERDIYRDLLGPVFDEMVADNVPWAVLKHAAITVMFDCTAGREAAENFWSSLGKRPEPADHRPAKKAANGTAVARKTTGRGSTGGTTSRPRSRSTN